MALADSKDVSRNSDPPRQIREITIDCAVTADGEARNRPRCTVTAAAAATICGFQEAKA